MRRLVITFVMLIALALLSAGVAYLHLGRAGVAIAMVIAAAKAGLVMAVFMDLARERSSTRWVALTTIALVLVFVGLSAADPATRDYGATPR